MIIIVGLGALGSHVALLLRNEPIALKLVDFDRVSTHNTQAQFHTTFGIGKNKAHALKQSLQGLFSVKTEAVPHRVTQDNVSTVLAEQGEKPHVVLDCTDNIEARVLISTHCQALQIPCLHGALSASGDFARVIWDKDFTPDAEGSSAVATCIDGEHLPFFAFTASCIALETQRFLATGKCCSWQLAGASMLRLT